MESTYIDADTAGTATSTLWASVMNNLVLGCGTAQFRWFLSWKPPCGFKALPRSHRAGSTPRDFVFHQPRSRSAGVTGAHLPCTRPPTPAASPRRTGHSGTSTIICHYCNGRSRINDEALPDRPPIDPVGLSFALALIAVGILGALYQLAGALLARSMTPRVRHYRCPSGAVKGNCRRVSGDGSALISCGLAWGAVTDVGCAGDFPQRKHALQGCFS